MDNLLYDPSAPPLILHIHWPGDYAHLDVPVRAGHSIGRLPSFLFITCLSGIVHGGRGISHCCCLLAAKRWASCSAFHGAVNKLCFEEGKMVYHVNPMLKGAACPASREVWGVQIDDGGVICGLHFGAYAAVGCLPQRV